MTCASTLELSKVRIGLETYRSCEELRQFDNQAREMECPPRGVYAFASASGEPHVRVLIGDGEPQVFGVGAGWHRIVGARDDCATELAQLRAAGRQRLVGI